MVLTILRRTVLSIDSKLWLSGIRNVSSKSSKKPSKAEKRKKDRAGKRNEFLATKISLVPMKKVKGAVIDAFFAQYPTFDYNPSATPRGEFRRMCKFFNWPQDESKKPSSLIQKARAIAGAGFRRAFVAQFNSLYGTDASKLENWHKLCQLLEIPIHPDVEECRIAVRREHVNIVDLVECPLAGRPLRKFRSLEELRQYSIRQKKFFPLEDAVGGVLEDLLRHLVSDNEPEVVESSRSR